MKHSSFRADLRALRFPFLCLLAASLLGGVLAGLLLTHDVQGEWLRANGLLAEYSGYYVADTPEGLEKLAAEDFVPLTGALPVGRTRLGLASALLACLAPLLLFSAFSYLFRRGGRDLVAALPVPRGKRLTGKAAAAWLLMLPSLAPAAVIPFLFAAFHPHCRVSGADLAAVLAAAAVTALYLDGIFCLALSEAGPKPGASLFRVLLLFLLLLVTVPLALQCFAFSVRQQSEALRDSELTNRILTAWNTLPLRLLRAELPYPGAGALALFASGGLLAAALGALRSRRAKRGGLLLFLLLLDPALLLVTREFTTNATAASRLLLGSALILCAPLYCLIGKRFTPADGPRIRILPAWLGTVLCTGLFVLLVELAVR